MQTVLQEGGLASGVQVQNIPGAGGTIGLAQFVTTKKRKGDVILVAGQTLQGAIITNHAPVTLDQVTPLARIVGEYEIVVVPVDSPIQTIADLVAKLKADPGGVSWGGGSVGSTDHILAGLIMKSVGADLSKLNYIAHSGGGEALSSVLGGHVTVGVSGYGEFGPQVDAGKLRALAVSSEERLPGVDDPDPEGAGARCRLLQLARPVRATGYPRGGSQGARDRDHQHGDEPSMEGNGGPTALDRSLSTSGRIRELLEGRPSHDAGYPHRPWSCEVNSLPGDAPTTLRYRQLIGVRIDLPMADPHHNRLLADLDAALGSGVGDHRYDAVLAPFGIGRDPVADALEGEVDAMGADGEMADGQPVDADRQPGPIDVDLAAPAVDAQAEAGLQHHEHRARRPGLRQAGDRIGDRRLAGPALEAAEQLRQAHART